MMFDKDIKTSVELTVATNFLVI